MLKTAHTNILETSTVLLAYGTEDPGYPLYRLYDRSVGRLFKPTVAETIHIRVDQGAGDNLAVDRLLIPSGHNLDGLALTLRYSDDDIFYQTVISWTGTAGLMTKTWAAETHRYWRLVISNPSSVPEIPELFLTSTYQWERGPVRPAGPLDKVFNAENAVTSGGQDRFLVHGQPKRRRIYKLPRVGEAQKDKLLELNDAWEGSKPFWLCDHTGDWIYGKLTDPMDVTEVAYQSYSVRFEFLEILP